MNLKQQAASRALEFVKNGMVVGLGTGSTTRIFIDSLGEKIKSGELHGIKGVPTSIASAAQARALGITITTLSKNPQLDIAIDGADEVDPQLDLIKGMGGALLREKIVEIFARTFIVIVDESKLVSNLGLSSPLPVEIVQFEAEAHVQWLNSLDCEAHLLRDEYGNLVETDNKNFLVHCIFPNGIGNVGELADKLANRPGIVEHGLFLNMANKVVVAGSSGTRILEREE